MMMTNEPDDMIFEALVKDARRHQPEPSDALLGRIMMDADNVLAQRARTGSVSGSRSLGAILLAALGGWTALSGMAAATVAGLWIGVAPPEALSDVTQSFWGGTVEVQLFETDGFWGVEG